MIDTLLALAALFGVPAALVTLIALTALVITRRRPHPRHRSASALGPGSGEPVARHAWTAAHLAHARITQLEARVRQLEALTSMTWSDHR